MNRDDFLKFHSAFKLACEMCNGNTPSDEGLQATYNALSSYSIDEVVGAIDDHMQDVIGHIHIKREDTRMSLSCLKLKLEGDPISDAFHAWKEVFVTASTCSRDAQITLSDPLSLPAIEQTGGWYSYTIMEEAETYKYRKKFVSAYLYLKKDPKETQRLIQDASRAGSNLVVDKADTQPKKKRQRLTEQDVEFFENNFMRKRFLNASAHRTVDENIRRREAARSPASIQREQALTEENIRVAKALNIVSEGQSITMDSIVTYFKNQMEESLRKEDEERAHKKKEEESDDIPY